MGGGAIIAVAAAARQRRLDNILDAYRLAQATSIARAQSLHALGLEPNNWVDGLRESGILRPGAAPDTWYLDEAANTANRNTRLERRRRVVRIAVGVSALAAVGGALLAYLVGGGLAR